MSTKNEWAVLDGAALTKMLEEKRNELAGLRFQAAHKALRQVDKIAKVKRDIARMLTVLRTR